MKKNSNINNSLSDRTPLLNDSPIIPLDKEHYEGHYANYDLQSKFQQLVSDIRNLHKTLPSEKYWIHFLRINLALKKFHEILINNDLSNEIDQRIANISNTIQVQLNLITELKRASSKKNTFVSNISASLLSLNQLTTQFTDAINGNTDPKSCPPPPTITPKHLLIGLPIIQNWIDKIGEQPPTDPLHRIFSHTYFHMKKTTITAIGFFAFALSTFTQSVFHSLLIDLEQEPYNDQSDALHTVAQMGLPVMAFGIGVTLSIYAMTQTKKFLENRRKEYLKEINDIESSPLLFRIQSTKADSNPLPTTLSLQT